MFSWHAIPFARLLLPFTVGIILQNYLPLTLLSGSCILVCACILLTLHQYTSGLAVLMKRKWVPGILLTLMYVSAGILLSEALKPVHAKCHYSEFKHAEAFSVLITGNTEEKKNHYIAYASVEYVINSAKQARRTQGKVLLRMHKQSLSKPPETGERYLIRARMQTANSALFPGSFDYRSYLKNRHVLNILESGNTTVFKLKNTENNLFSMAEDIRDKGLELLGKYIPSKGNAGIAEALLLGYRSNIDPGTNEAFRNTGTLHILSVSGLHVGLVFMLLGFAGGFIQKLPRGEFCRAVFMLSGLWMYALITGLSPSVVRASVMFSLFSTGKLFKRSANVYNIVYASAFLIVSWDTNMIFDAGLQLSYAAVLGIVYLYPKLKARFRPANKIAAYAFDLAAVSVSAQAFTMPVSLFYFSQFPTYFLFYNMMLIPLFTIALFTAIGVIGLSFLPVLAVYSGKALNTLLDICTLLLGSSTKIPGAVVQGLYTNLFQMALMYAALAFFIGFLMFKSKKKLLGCLLIWVCYESYGCYKQVQNSNARYLAVFNFKHNAVFICVDGLHALLTKSDQKPLSERQVNHIHQFLTQNGIRSIKYQRSDKSIVETNFSLKNGLGFQFFDIIVTLKLPVRFIGQKHTFNSNQYRVNPSKRSPKKQHNNLFFSILHKNKPNEYLCNSKYTRTCSKTCQAAQFMVLQIDKL